MPKINKNFISFTLLIVVILTICVNAQSEQELLLKKRVDLFYKYFSDGKIDKMAELMSKRNKQENADENGKKKARVFLEKLSSLKPKICTKVLKIENTRAIVAVEISFWDEEKQVWLGGTDNNVWVFEDNNWFFKSQIEK